MGMTSGVFGLSTVSFSNAATRLGKALTVNRQHVDMMAAELVGLGGGVGRELKGAAVVGGGNGSIAGSLANPYSTGKLNLLPLLTEESGS